ncbi:MAG TPA: ATP-binding cassette domain-containing protein, partial [Terriglobales bacterium]|nr:ATP-binding cassette domain-containing protein [Terriglobales bacterium]
RLFAHIMELPLNFHLDRQTGAVGQTLESALQGYQMILHHLVYTVLPVAVELSTIIVVLARLAQPAFIVLFCGAIVCYVVAFAYASTTVSRTAKSATAAHIAAHAVMSDSVMNYEVVKCFSAETMLQEKVSAALARTEAEWVTFYRLYAWSGLRVAVIFSAFLAATMLYAARQMMLRAMTIGDFVLVSTYMLQVVRPIEMLGYAVQAMLQGVAMLEQMIVLFRQKPEPRDACHCLRVNGPGAVEFRRVSLSYAPNSPALRNVSFRVPAGKTLGVIGASGSGKSTLVRLLVRLFDPDSGTILLDDVPISKLSLFALRQAIAVVPQDTILFNDSIAYNIAVGKPRASLMDVVEAAKVAHLHNFIASLPHGYETRVGERGVKLSGGEKQRISIARAALRRSLVYVFDEATSSLDSRTEREILANLREIARERTTLVIAHRLSTIVHADEIVVLDGGMVVERGTHFELLRRRGHYAGLWEAQQQGSAVA